MYNGTDLYTLKWSKDGREFYRSVPRASVRKNRRLVFPLPGVNVDFENSKVRSRSSPRAGKILPAGTKSKNIFLAKNSSQLFFQQISVLFFLETSAGSAKCSSLSLAQRNPGCCFLKYPPSKLWEKTKKVCHFYMLSISRNAFAKVRSSRCRTNLCDQNSSCYHR